MPRYTIAMQCPICKKPVKEPVPTEPMGAFPFCSDRCKLIDLGRWIDGKYQIAVVEDATDSGEPEDFDGLIPPAPHEDVGSD